MFNIDRYSNISITKYNSGVISVEPIIDGTNEPYELQDGDIVILSVKSTIGDDEPVLQKTYTKEECTDCESDTTEITLTIEPEDTANLDYYDYVYDVAILSSDGGFYTFIGGGEKPLNFRVLPSISKPPNIEKTESKNMQSLLSLSNPPKISSISPIVLITYLRLGDEAISDNETKMLLTQYSYAAKDFIQNYTGLTSDEMDNYPALSLAFLCLISDFYDSRSYKIDSDTINPTIKQILSLYNRNFF